MRFCQEYSITPETQAAHGSAQAEASRASGASGGRGDVESDGGGGGADGTVHRQRTAQDGEAPPAAAGPAQAQRTGARGGRGSRGGGPGRGRGGRRAGGRAAVAVPVGRVHKAGTAASSAAATKSVGGRKIRAKFVDLRGMIGEDEYRRLVEPAKATAHKRKAERMEERARQPPRVRMGTVHRWTPTALANFERRDSTRQGGESSDMAPG